MENSVTEQKPKRNNPIGIAGFVMAIIFVFIGALPLVGGIILVLALVFCVIGFITALAKNRNIWFSLIGLGIILFKFYLIKHQIGYIHC